MEGADDSHSVVNPPDSRDHCSHWRCFLNMVVCTLRLCLCMNNTYTEHGTDFFMMWHYWAIKSYPTLKNVFCLLLLHLVVWPPMCKLMYMQSLILEWYICFVCWPGVKVDVCKGLFDMSTNLGSWSWSRMQPIQVCSGNLKISSERLNICNVKCLHIEMMLFWFIDIHFMVTWPSALMMSIMSGFCWHCHWGINPVVNLLYVLARRSEWYCCTGKTHEWICTTSPKTEMKDRCWLP